MMPVLEKFSPASLGAFFWPLFTLQHVQGHSDKEKCIM